MLRATALVILSSFQSGFTPPTMAVPYRARRTWDYQWTGNLDDAGCEKKFMTVAKMAKSWLRWQKRCLNLAKLQKDIKSCQKLPKAAKSSQLRPKLPKVAKGCQNLPKIAKIFKMDQKLPKDARSWQKLLKDSKSCQKLPKDVKGCQKFPKDA